jgi:hypothetical protein
VRIEEIRDVGRREGVSPTKNEVSSDSTSACAPPPSNVAPLFGD